MARPTKQRPPVKQETEEMEAQEMGETSEEETREGTEDGASMKNSRKRSPKGAKNTKAPMDADCGICKSGKPCTCKAKKDGGCGGYGKRGDALTPQEYLAACDLGIQDRSRPYIRARLDTTMNLTPSTVRADLKCGKGSISKGEKCSKGAATEAENKVVNQAGVRAKDKYSFKKQQKAWGQYASLGMSVAGGIGGAISPGGGGVAGALGRGVIGAAAGAGIGRVLGTAEGTLRAAGNRTARAYGRNRANIKKANTAIAAKNPKWKAEYAAAKAKGASNKELTNLSIKQAGEIDKILQRSETQIWTNANGRPAKRRDSIYAAGFTPDFDQLAI